MGNKIRGVYSLNGKHACRIHRDGKSVHLGTYDSPELAGKVYDTACLIFGKPLSSYNDPFAYVPKGLLQKVLVVLRNREALSDEDVVAITNRFTVIEQLTELISEGKEEGVTKNDS